MLLQGVCSCGLHDVDLTASKRAKKRFSSSASEAPASSDTGFLSLYCVMCWMPCHIFLGLLPVKCSSIFVGCLGLFDSSFQVGSGLAVLEFVARPEGGVVEFEEFLDIAGHPGFLVWENPDEFLNCYNVHAVFDEGEYRFCVLL